MKTQSLNKKFLAALLLVSACSPSFQNKRNPASQVGGRSDREQFESDVRAQAALYNLRKDQKSGSILMLAYIENQHAKGLLKTDEDWARARKRGFEIQNDYVAAVKAIADVNDAASPLKYQAVKMIVETAFGEASGIPGAGWAVGGAKPVVDGYLKMWEDSLKAEVQHGSTALVASNNALAGMVGEKALEQIFRGVESDPIAKKQYDELLSSVANVTTDQDSSVILKNNPEFAVQTNIAYLKAWIDQNSDENGNLKSPIPDEIVMKYLEITRNLSKKNQAALAKVLAEQGAQGKDLKAIKDTIDKEKAERRRSEQKMAQEREEEQRFQMKMAAGQAGVSIVSTIVGFGNPQKARQIAGVGNAALSTASLLRNFEKGLRGDSGARFMSSVIFSGNMLSIGIQVFSLFADGGPSPDQMILDQIDALREDVNSLRKMTEARFDQVDRSLQEILLSLSTGFENLGYQLKSGGIDVEAIRRNVEAISKQNQRLDFNIRSQLKALAAREFNQKVDSCLLRRKIFQDSDAWMDSRLFEDCFLYFKTAASSNSIDQLSTIPVSDDLLKDDADAHRALAAALANPVEELLPLLTRLGVYKFLNEDGTPMLPELAAFPFPANPVAWSLATQSFVELGYGAPQFLKKGEVDSVNAFFGPAETIKTVSRILVMNSRKEPRNVFWQQLFLRYSKSVDRMFDSLSKNYDDWLASQTQGLDVFSPELPAAPKTSTRYAIVRMPPCSRDVTQPPEYTNAWSTDAQRRQERLQDTIDAPAFEVLPELARLGVAYDASKLAFCYESIDFVKDHDDVEWYRHEGKADKYTNRLKDAYDGLFEEHDDGIELPHLGPRDLADRTKDKGGSLSVPEKPLRTRSKLSQEVQRHTIRYGRPRVMVRVSHLNEYVIGRITLTAQSNQAPIAYQRSSDKFFAELKSPPKFKFHLFDKRTVQYGAEISKFGGVKSFVWSSEKLDEKGEQTLRETLKQRRADLGNEYMRAVRNSIKGASELVDSINSVEMNSLLIQKFVQVAFPVSMQNDELLRSMLAGTNGLIRRQRFTDILETSNSLPEVTKAVSRDQSALQAHVLTKVLPAAVENPEVDPTLQVQLAQLEDFRKYWNGLGSSADVMTALDHLRTAVKAHIEVR